MSKLPERLKEYMEERGLTQLALSKATDIYNTNISDFLAGIHLPSYENFIRLLYFFDCSADYLLGLVDLPTEEKLYPVPPFHTRLRWLLKEHGISQGKLQKTLPVSSSGLYGWLSGKQLPTLPSLIRLAEYFNCSVDLLIGRVR